MEAYLRRWTRREIGGAPTRFWASQYGGDLQEEWYCRCQETGSVRTCPQGMLITRLVAVAKNVSRKRLTAGRVYFGAQFGGANPWMLEQSWPRFIHRQEAERDVCLMLSSLSSPCPRSVRVSHAQPTQPEIPPPRGLVHGLSPR